jgi:hybrid cluster-associated redox disulfide protein
MASITKDIGFSELLEKHPEAVEVLMNSGMHCIGCPAAMFETLEQGAMMHGVDVKKLVEEINNKLKVKKDGNSDKKRSEDEINKKWEKMKDKND